MSASALVLGLVRAHFRRDDMAFAGSAAMLTRSAQPAVRAQIEEIIRKGYLGRGPAPPGGFTGDNYRRNTEPLKELKQAPIGPLQPLRRVSFPELMLDSDLQALLDELVLELEFREELAGRNLRARNRFLFHGMPGNGKSSGAAALANALGVKAYCVSIPQLVGSHLGETGKNLAALFDSIRDGMVVVFDEIDAVGSRRGQGEQACDKEMNATVNCFLMLLDRNKSGVIVATTNRPDMLDEALRRRFDEQILFPEPSSEQMTDLAWRLAQKFGVPPVYVTDCKNFDEVTKRVENEARRIVMKELIAADTASDEGEEETTENETATATATDSTAN